MKWHEKKISDLVFRSLLVVIWRRVGRGVTFRSLSGLITRSRVILKSFGVAGRSIVFSGIELRYLRSVLLQSFGVVAECSVGCGVANWVFSVVFWFSVIRRGGSCVESWGYVILGRLSWGCVARGRVVLCHFCVIFDRWWCDTLEPRCSSWEHSSTWDPRCSKLALHT